MLFAGSGATLFWILPIGGDPLFWQGAIMLAAALGAGAVLIVAFDDRSPGALGFAWTRRSGRETWTGFVLGAAAFTLAVAILVAGGGLSFVRTGAGASAFVAVLFVELGVLAIAAAAEEALFRGYAFQVLVQGVGPVVATVAASAAFAVAHAANPNIDGLALVNIFLAGVLLSAAYLKTRSLWFPTGVHLGWNWMMAAGFALPVSGWDRSTSPPYAAEVSGPTWFTGGAFGPEGGVAATAAIVAATICVLLAPGIVTAEEMRIRRPLVDAR